MSPRAAHRDYRACAERAIAAFAWEGDPTAARRGLITPVGWRTSARPSRRNAVQRIWKGARK